VRVEFKSVSDTETSPADTPKLPATGTDLDKRAVDTVRVLAADAVQKSATATPAPR